MVIKMKIKKDHYELRISKRGVKCSIRGEIIPKGEKYYKNIKFLGFLSSPANVCLNCWSKPQTDPKQSKLNL
jgi:hypothetical protein